MNRSLVTWGVLALVAVAVIGVVMFFQLPSPDTPPEQAQAPAAPPAQSAPGGSTTGGSSNGGTSTASAPTAAQPSAPASAAASGDTTQQAARPSRPAPTTATGQPAPAATPAPAPMAPEFDIVRVDDGGNVVIAGRGTPGCTVEVREGDTVIGNVDVDRNGDWVLVPDAPLSAGERQLSLAAKCGDAAPLPSERIVVLAVPERGSGALAVAVPREGKEPTQVLQTPVTPGTTGEAPEVAVAAVDYDDKGEVALSGTAAPGSTVQVYVDNEPIGAAKTDDAGRWTLSPERNVDPGSYELRVDQVTPEGKVVARAQIPFVRGEPLTDLPAGRVVIIQPGDFLWHIARERYGSGVQYTLIYEANRAQIRDPDLIFPGQVFLVPKVN